jgi:hypothetical protein
MKLAPLLAVLAFGCSTPSVLTPATGPDTVYPCGVSGVVCSGAGQPAYFARLCCSESEVCGGTPGCPAGMCCYVGDGVGAREPHPQRSSK